MAFRDLHEFSGYFLMLMGLYILLLMANVRNVAADRTNKKIYEPVQGALACFRRLNATHQIGCSSKLTGNVGVLHVIDSPDSLEWVTTTGPHSPYVAIMNSENFAKQPYLERLRDSGRVGGVLLLYNHTENPESFSLEQSCPNRGFGMYTDPKNNSYCQPWNSKGTGLLFEDWGFPIFFVSDRDEVKKVMECYSDFNDIINGTERDWPLCAAQLESHMLAAVDSETCIRRGNVFSLQPTRICDPMGGLNVWGSLNPRSQQRPYRNNSVIVVAARSDASSMFDKITPGADSAVTAITAFLATVKHLSEHLYRDGSIPDDIDNIYFMLFSGEAFDYIGSSRIVYDMRRNSFPFKITDNSNTTTQPALLKLEHIKYFIELNQVGLSDDPLKSRFFIHSNNASDFINIANGAEVLKDLRIKFEAGTSTSEGQYLPPTSLQSFVKYRGDLPGIVISNYNRTFLNKYYNSIYDDADYLNYVHEKSTSSVQERIAELSAAVARTIASISGAFDVSSIKPDKDYVDELLYCYLEAGNCTIFQQMAGHDQLPTVPFSMYVGVYNNINYLSIFAKNLLSTYQGTNVSKTIDECKKNYENQTVDYVWISEVCYETTVNWSLALSPAFHLDGQISWDEWNSGLYSTWTESVWQKFSVRIFVKPSRLHEALILVSGIIVFLFSFVSIWWLNKKSDILFQSRYSGYVPISSLE